ncbi:MAG TPA: hypothetical protein VK453_25215 [Micromonosporaceae bacterium]|nr:hypothetical protein [Micromonosporaceae bacterium]
MDRTTEPYPAGFNNLMVDRQGHQWRPDTPAEAQQYANAYGARFLNQPADEANAMEDTAGFRYLPASQVDAWHLTSHHGAQYVHAHSGDRWAA